MNKRLLTPALLIAVALFGGRDAAVGAAGPGASGPGVTVNPDRVAVGQDVKIQGTGWPAQTLLTVEFCGNLAMDATSDCAVLASKTIASGPDGTFGVRLTTPLPPQPCPCVVRVGGTSLPEVRTPIAIVDAPQAPPQSRVETPDVTRAVELSALDISTGGSWHEWFGAPVERTLSFVVTNTGSVALIDPPITVTVGRGKDPTGIAAAPRIARLEPGQTTSVEVPVRLDALSFGRYTAKVHVGGLGQPADARKSMSSYPWGLIIAAVVVLQLVLLSVRNRVRRRADDVAPPWKEPPGDNNGGTSGPGGGTSAAAGLPPPTVDWAEPELVGAGSAAPRSAGAPNGALPPPQRVLSTPPPATPGRAGASGFPPPVAIG